MFILGSLATQMSLCQSWITITKARLSKNRLNKLTVGREWARFLFLVFQSINLFIADLTCNTQCDIKVKLRWTNASQQSKLIACKRALIYLSNYSASRGFLVALCSGRRISYLFANRDIGRPRNPCLQDIE